MQFSILVPVYNAEKYIDECLHSILPQIGPEDEIILCDDASTDGSLSRCRKFADQYPNTIRIIVHDTNEGLLITRRHLFASAKGDYVLCVDADDELEPEALPALRKTIAKTNADMVLYNARCIHLDGSTELFKPRLSAEHLYSGEEKSVCYETLFQNKYMNSLCTKAIKREILDDQVDYSPFRELTIGEDLFQSYPLFDRAAGIYYLDRSLYRYYKRENSMTNNNTADLYRSRCILWPREDQYLVSWKISEESLGKCYSKRCNEIIGCAVKAASTLTFPAFSERMEQFLQDGFFSGAWRYARLTMRYQLYGRFLLNKRLHMLYAALKLEAMV